MSPVEQRPLQAIGLMLVAVFLMSTMDVALKLLVEHYPSMQVVFFRCVVSIPVFLVWILATDRRQFRTAYPLGHVLRALLGILMLWAVGECFRELQLADAYAIFFAAPLLITLLSGPVLGEPAGWVRICAALFGFGGVLVVLQPSGSGWLEYGGVMALLGMVCYAVSVLLLRKLGSRDSTITIAFWFTLLVGLGSFGLALPGWQPVDSAHGFLLLLLGASGMIGQVLTTAAYRRASAAIVAPFDYAHMLWAVIYGLWIWGYLPDLRTWIGVAIVTASGLFVAHREHRAARHAARVLASQQSGGIMKPPAGSGSADAAHTR